MQIWTFRTRFEAIKCNFQPFKRDSNYSNANLNYLNEIQRNRMQIQTIPKEFNCSNGILTKFEKRFKTFKCKFKPFERNSKQSNTNWNHSKGILTIRMQIRTIPTTFEAIECKFEPFTQDLKQSNANSNHSKGLLTIQLQIRMRFEAIKCKCEPFEWNSNHSNANSNQIQTIQKGF